MRRRIIPALALVLASGCGACRDEEGATDGGALPDGGLDAGPPDSGPADGGPLALRVSLTLVASVPPDPPPALWLERVPFDQIGFGQFAGPRTPMERRGDGTFAVTLDLPEGYLLRYRYAAHPEDAASVEVRFDDGPIVVREAVAAASEALSDVVHRWPWSGGPLPALLEVPVRVTRGGAPVADAVVSGPGGAVRLEGNVPHSFADRADVEGRVRLRLPAGPARLVASSDGAGFAQATVEVRAGMPETDIELLPAPLRPVPAVVLAPPELPTWAELHLLGSVPQLGFPYRFGYSASLRGARLRWAGGRSWTGEALLPVGSMDLFLTTGDGFWGRVLDSAGAPASLAFVHRDGASEVHAAIERLGPPGGAAVTFLVTVPAHTPPEDTVYLRPDALGPGIVPMLPMGGGRWRAFLHLPAGMRLSYTYDRSPYDHASRDAAGPRSFEVPADASTTLEDVVAAWERLPADVFQPALDLDPGESTDFARGVGLPDFWDADHLPFSQAATRRLRGIGVEWVNVKPFVGLDHGDGRPPMLQPAYTRGELARHLDQLHAAGFKIYLVPQTNGPQPTDASSEWWTEWFQRYRLWLLGFATLAAEKGVEAFAPVSAQTFGNLFTAEHRGRWLPIIAEVRTLYGGLLVVDGTVGGTPAEPIHAWDGASDIGLLAAVDGIFADLNLRWAESTGEEPSAAVLSARMDPLFAGFERYGLPVWIRLPMPSVDGGLFDANIARPETPEWKGPDWQVDLDEQARLFEAFFLALPRHPGIRGLFTWGQGYTAVVDNGHSVTGKPAERVLRDHYLGQ